MRAVAGIDSVILRLPPASFLWWLVSFCWAVVASGQQQEGTGTICSPASNTFTARINFNEGHLGYFQFAECDGVNPTIGLKIGTTYVFDQSDVSNWFHPMGFAYGPDGALDDQDELELGVSRTGSSCATTLSCPAPLYHLNGQFLGDTDANAEDFGLDNYEPKFFLPLLDWIGQGTFSINVTFDDTSIDQDAFYFCHIHQFMSGRIKFLDESGNPLVAENKPSLGYEYDKKGEFDQLCGTVGLDDWQLPNDQCAERYVCGIEQARDSAHRQFADCLEAMNCKMMAEMSTNVGPDPASLFMYHMIPHHENAVNMAKALLPNVPCDDLTKEDDPDCVLNALARDIINTQNFQIQTMRTVLEALGAPPTDDCTVTVASVRVSGAAAVSGGGGPAWWTALVTGVAMAMLVISFGHNV